MSRVTRFGAGCIAELGAVCAEVGIARPLLVATRRGAGGVSALPVVGVFDGVLPHVPIESVTAAADAARAATADGLVALGGGSAIDTAKAVVARLAAEPDGPVLRVVAIPTTYAGAEWTPYFGMLTAPGVKGGGSDERAAPVAALYDPELTLDLPLRDTVGTSMNALAHCAEAYYHPSSSRRAARHADTGARAIAYALPLVVERPEGVYGRTRLLEGAMRAALALAESGLCLGHAMAQGLGGRYGLPQGAMNAICLPAALRFNEAVAPAAIARLGRALGGDAPTRCRELAALGGFSRLRDEGVPEHELPEVAAAIAARPGARLNPRPAGAEEVEALLRSIW